MAARSGAIALELRGVVKIFGEQRALDRATLTVRAGSVHALLGENGSGKSTMIKILSGLYQPDAGELTVHGERVELPLTPLRSRALGLQFVHQDLGLVPTLSVAENFMLGRLSSGESGALISDRRMQRETRAVLADYGVVVDPAAAVSELQPVERALLAIVRAVNAMEGSREDAGSAGAEHASAHGRPGVLVLDEPTVFLPRRDVDRVFDLVRTLAAEGHAVILVSHDLDEVLAVTDEITVLRDGCVAGTGATAALAKDELVRLIVGRSVELLTTHGAEREASFDDVPALSVTGLSGSRIHDVSFVLRRGEILGLTGLAGSGFDQIPYLLYGSRPASAGVVSLRRSDAAAAAEPAMRGVDLTGLNPRGARRLGFGLLPSDRRNTAGIGTLDLVDNVTMLQLDRFRSWFGLDRSGMREATGLLLDEFDVRPRDPGHGFGTLSGGNQQKALLAKWLSSGPSVLLVDEPTQGVDIGARGQIFELLRTAAAEGTSVICASTDHEQLAALTDRTLVFDHGRVVAELTGAQLTKDAISQACLSGAQPEQTNQKEQSA